MYKEVLRESQIDFFIECFIQDNLASHFNVLPHWHDCFELLYIIEGSAFQNINNKSFLAKKDDLILIKPRDIHDTRCNYNDDVKILVIKFMPDIVDSIYSKQLDTRYISAFLNFDINPIKYLDSNDQSFDELKKLLKNIYIEFNDKSEWFELSLKGYFYTLITILLRIDMLKLPKTGINKKYIVLEEIIKNIEQSNMNITLKSISKKLNYNYSYCSRYFKEATGKGFSEFCDYVKISKAENLIIQKGFNITEAALECGFSNVSSFTRTYKRIKGYSPMALKKVKK